MFGVFMEENRCVLTVVGVPDAGMKVLLVLG